MATNNSIDSVNGVKVGGIHTVNAQSTVTPTTWNLPANSLATSTLMNAAITNVAPGDNLITTVTLINESLSGGPIIIATAASPTSNYIISSMRIGGPTGGGVAGDRDISVTSGAIVWSVIPAATLLALSNLRWGDVGFPAPVAANWTQASTGAGNNVVVAYSGGTTDYAALTIRIEVRWRKIA